MTFNFNLVFSLQVRLYEHSYVLPGNPSNCKMPSELSSPVKLLPL